MGGAVGAGASGGEAAEVEGAAAAPLSSATSVGADGGAVGDGDSVGDAVAVEGAAAVPFSPKKRRENHILWRAVDADLGREGRRIEDAVEVVELVRPCWDGVCPSESLIQASGALDSATPAAQSHSQDTKRV